MRPIVILVPMLLLFVVLPLFRQTIGLYVDWLWFAEVGYRDVFTRILATKAAAGLLAGAVAFLAIFVNLRAVRPAPGADLLADGALPNLPSWFVLEPLYRRLLLPASLVVGLLATGQGVALWESYLRFRHGAAFGTVEPLFQRDVGFYVFQYPFLRSVYSFLLLVGFLTLAAVIGAYVLCRGIRLGPDRFHFTAWAKGHVLILAAALLVTKAWGYSLDAYALLLTPGGASFGASYTDVNATLPALRVLVVLAGLAAIACLVQVRRPGVAIALVGLAVWLAGSLIGLSGYPLAVQRLRVVPNEIAAERPYIERTIAATNRAYNLDRIESRPFPASESLTPESLARNAATVKNIRLWEHRPALDSYAQLQEIRTYYKFVDVDNDRYVVDGEYRQLMVSARELSHGHLPSRIWINEHLVYTHGYGAVVGPVNRVTPEGLPEFFVKDIPPVSTGAIRITRPEIYYGELANPYVLVRTRQRELNYPVGDQNVYTTYEGAGGVGIGSLWRRLLFAAHFAEIKMLLSDDLSPESRILYVRQIEERVRKIAPFLRLDRDPYLVVSADGRLVWMLDAYTTSEHYPYSQPTRGVGNYIRNPVKITVDAYDGTVRFYLIEPDEPIATTYARAFPGLFRPISEMPADLRGHVRYPQDLLAIQARTYAAFHMLDPQVFYNREDLWTIPTRKADGRDVDIEPYYTIMRLPGESREEFILLLPFTPVRRDNMIAWLAARSDGEHYGKLVQFDFPKGKLVYGPRQVDARIDQDAFISQQLSLWSQAGSQVIRGSLLAIPIEESLLYVQPLYLAAAQGRLPELKRVITAYGNHIVMEETLDRALERLFGSPDGRPAVTARPRAEGAPAAAGAQPAPRVEQLAAQALDRFARARESFGRGDWAGFAQQFRELEETLRQLQSSGGPRPAP